MASISFQDYSRVLEPLPALGSASDTGKTSTSKVPGIDFQHALAQASTRATEDSPKQASTQAAQAAKSSGLSPQASEKLMKECKDLEGVLLGILLKDLGKRFTDGGVFGSSFESGFYQDMFFTEIGKSIGDQGRSLGIADTLYKDIMLKEQNAL